MYNEEEFFNFISLSIKRLRINNKYTCEKLAELVDTDYSSINQIENNKQKPRSYTLYKILKVLGIDILEKITEKSKERLNLEAQVVEKTKLMSDCELSALLLFIEDFKITKK